METVTLVLPLEATTVNNPSDSRSNSGLSAGVKVEQQQDRWLSKMGHGLSYDHSILEYKVIKFPP